MNTMTPHLADLHEYWEDKVHLSFMSKIFSHSFEKGFLKWNGFSILNFIQSPKPQQWGHPPKIVSFISTQTSCRFWCVSPNYWANSFHLCRYCEHSSILVLNQRSHLDAGIGGWCCRHNCAATSFRE